MVTTTAAVLRGPDLPFSLEEVELPGLGPREIRVRLVATGMCHSDLVARRTPAAEFRPTIFGHEGAGVVEAVGSDVSRVAVGDPVALSYDSCGHCRQCRGGEPWYCSDFIAVNSTGFGPVGARNATDGNGDTVGSRFFAQSSFARHAIATETSAVVVPTDVDLELLGPLGCGMQTGAGAVMNVFRPRLDDAVAVFGVGAVGLAAVMAARAQGVRTIVAVDIDGRRRDLAAELGATVTVDGADPELAAILRASTGGIRYALDTTGHSGVVQAALGALGERGMLALVGANTVNLSISPIDLLGRTITYTIEGHADPQRFVPELLALWRAGRFPFERLLQTYALADIDAAERDSLAGDTVKPILVP